MEANQPANGGTPAARRARKPRTTGAALLILLGLLLVGAIGLVWRTVSSERSERQQFAQSDAILSTLHELNFLTVSAETGQRGYFITLNSAYLAPYRTAQADYGRVLERLQILIASEADPRELMLQKRIDELTHARFAELAETVGQIQGGNREAAGMTIVSDRGKNLMEQQQRALRELEEIERAERFAASAAASKLEGNLIPALVLLTVMIFATLGIGLWQVRQIAEADAHAASADALAAANERVGLLAQELNHRVKNLFTVVLAIVRLTGRDDPAMKPVVERIVARIEALGKAHDVTRGARGGTGNLRRLVEVALSPYASDRHASSVNGPDIDLDEERGVPVGLLLHELATNAVKYGAWAQPGGLIDVRWAERDGLLEFRWQETCSGPCGPPDTARKGFGSMLAESTARQLEGKVERSFGEQGMTLVLTFPATSAG